MPGHYAEALMNTYLIWSFVKPSQWLLWGALLGIALWRRPLGRPLLLGVAIAIVVSAILPLGALLTVPLESRFPRPDVTTAPTGIIVLAGAEQAVLSDDYGETQLNSAGDRLTTFLRLAHRYPNARLVHAGGAPGDGGSSQSSAAKRLIYGIGIDSERIVFSDESSNTCDDARAAAERIRPAAGERWLLVTSAMHMPRAVACFRATDWPVTPYPTDYRYSGSIELLSFALVANLANIDFAMHEWIGLVYYRVTGRTGDLFPAPTD